MSYAPPRSMVSTRSATKRKEEQREALEKDAQQYRDCKVENISKNITKEAMETVETGNVMDQNPPGPSAAQSVRNSSRKKSTSTSSILARKKRLELEAAEATAKIRMELISKKLEADLAELENEGSSKCSEPLENCSSKCSRKCERVITWLESSRQELNNNVADELCPAPQESNLYRTNEPAVGTLPRDLNDVSQLYSAPAPRENNDATVHALASALKDLAASTSAKSDDRMLNRLCTPKNLPKYAGDPLEWLHFKKSYEESSRVCRFSDRENLWRLRESLVGPAKEAVTALLISATSADEVMATLELQFGNPDAIISKILLDINKLRPLPQEYQKDLISFAVKVRNCVAAITAIGHDDYLKGNNITSVIISKLPIVLISKWTDYCYTLLNNKEKPKLLIMSEFLSEEAKKISMTSVNLSIVHNKQNYSEYVKHRTLYVNSDDGEQSDGELCRYCHASKHLLQDCKKFKKSLRRDRWTFVKRHGICYKCLTAKHKQDTCPKPVCDVDNCGLPHHRLLHYVTKPNSVQRDSVNITDVTASDTNSQAEVVNHLKLNSCCKVLLKTVPIYLHGPNGIFRCAALLDDGSTVTLISAALAARAGLRGSKQSMRVCGAWNNSEVICHSEILELELSNRTGTKFSVSARSVENLNLPVQNLTSVDLCSYELMNPEIKSAISEGQYKPEILIGQDNYELLLPLEIIKGTPDNPYLTRTTLGWSLHGRTRYTVEKTSTQSTLFLSVTDSSESERILREMQDEMRQSFAIESVGVTCKPRQNVLDVQATEHLEKTATLKNGRWYVGIPWKGTFTDMPTSYEHALARLQGVERKMKNNQGFAARYKERIDHLFTNNYASKLTETVSPNQIWYLPHFGVDNPNKQKLRLVFDAAAKNNGLCLNDYLLKGPDLLISLYGIMLRFRENKIAITADIKDMFLRIKVHDNDRDAFRFLWRESPEQLVNTYVMTSLIFGANCSPFISQFVKNKNTERFMSTKPAAVEAIRQQHYMDDYIDSINDNITASQLVNDVTYIHKQGGFEIRNWSSNIESVLSDLPEESRRSTSVSFKDGQQYEGERTLGLIWFPEDDELGFDVSFKRIPTQIVTGEKIPTKREMLRVLMSIFDVYGFLSPITIKGKIMLQDTWRSGISWDDEIPSKIFAKWIEWLSLMRMISNVRLPRHYEVAAGRSERDRRDETTRASETDASTLAPNSASKQPAPCYTNLELHIFSDSSSQALCAVGYFRWIDNSDKQKIRVAFVTSKCRVAPVKYVSMPRLELQAAVMAARLAHSIISEHRLTIKRKVFWCDSSTVLNWIRNDERKYKVYVAHRLGEIDELTDVNEWRYIPTQLNIADIATRESCAMEQLTSDWFYGPSFLYKDEESWPGEAELQPIISDDDLQCINNINVTPTYLPAVPEPTRFSSWLHLLRSTFVMLSFINKCRKLTCVDDGTMMERAENLLLKYSQMKSFPDDLQNLKRNGRLDKRSKLLTLTPVLGEDGLMRLGGRIDAALEISHYVKRPVILDGRCHITHLIVKYHHVKAYHGNQETVVNELKQRYWIIKLRPTVKYISSKCMLCRIRRAQPAPPRMGNLPEGRLAHHQRPFTFTGIDLFGPLEVTVLRRREKRYGVIFTCLTVRAIHLEIVNQLTTDALIMALRRMAARRGWPRYLYSDNGTNLRGADKELTKCVSELDKEKLKEGVSTYSASTTWIFIPPASPHWGGAWERLIRSIKSALKVILKERAPRDETLLTLMIEVEHIVNSRPLTHVAVEPTSKESLTPNHFLLGTTSNLPTLGTFDESDTYLRKQWRISQRLADMFWKRWVREVLPDMRPRKKWHEETRSLQVGDLVLIVDPNSPRNVWPKGLVQNVIPGRDGRVRVIDVMTKTGLLRRNSARVARIPIDDECCSSTKGGSVSDA